MKGKSLRVPIAKLRYALAFLLPHPHGKRRRRA
jgi:hypothetical protein